MATMPRTIGVGDLLGCIKALRSTGDRVERITLNPQDALHVTAEITTTPTDIEVTFADPTLAGGMLFRLLGVPVHKRDSVELGQIDVVCVPR
jgi:hypothetical protein